MADENLKTDHINDQELAEIQAWALRKRAEDNADKREAQKRIAYFCTSGVLLYPSGIVLAELMGLVRSVDLLSEISGAYYFSLAGILGAYFGFTTWGDKK